MKRQLRKKLLEKRNALSEEEVIKKSKFIIRKLLHLKEFKEAKTALLYVSKENEADTTKLIKKLLKENKKTIIVPRVKKGKNELELHKISSFNDLATGHYSVLEPIKSSLVSADKIELVIVPGIAFDKKGNRLGYGNGYYDVLLKKVLSTTIALAYDFQVINHVPSDKLDVPLDIIITDKQVIRCIN